MNNISALLNANAINKPQPSGTMVASKEPDTMVAIYGLQKRVGEIMDRFVDLQTRCGHFLTPEQPTPCVTPQEQAPERVDSLALSMISECYVRLNKLGSLISEMASRVQ